MSKKKWIGKIQMIRNVTEQLNKELESEKENETALHLYNCTEILLGVIESYQDIVKVAKKKK